MTLPLEGIRVIDLGQIYAVPYCTMQLAYMGADVIKVEPPGTGELLRLPEVSRGASYSFLMLNANKKSVTLNLKDPRGREILLRLLEGADVLAENYLGGVMESLGLGYEQLAARFPKLIYASGKGYGAGSRWERLGAMDPTVQAASGFISVTGFADRGVKTPATFIDMGTGSHLASAILAALIQRGRTGRGQRVEVAMLDVCVPAMTTLIAQVLDGRKFHRMGNRHWGAVPCNVYPAADGGELMIFCLTEAHWRSCAKLMGREDLLADPRYKSHGSRMRIADEVDGLISAWTRTIARDALIDILIAEGVPCAPVRSTEEIIDDPEIAGRAMLIDSDFPTRGPVRVLGSPLKLSDAPCDARAVRRPPALGEHNAEVFATVGIDAAALARLKNDGVV